MSTALIIGAGRMAGVRLAAVQGTGCVNDVVVATRNASYGAELKALGARVIDVSELSHVEPAMTFVASATSNHVDDVAAALALGAPILCEKPLAGDAESAFRLSSSATEQGVPLYVAFQRHFDSGLRRLRARFADGSLGVPYHLRLTDFDHTPGSPEFIAGSGGIYKDLLVHGIDCAVWLAGSDVRSVYALGSVRNWTDYADFADVDTATVLLTLDDGLVVTLHATRHQPVGHDVRVEVVGSDDAVSVGLTERSPLHALDAPELLGRHPWQDFQERFADAFVAETAAFVRFALGLDAFDGTTAEAAAQIVAVAEACERSQVERQAVSLPRRLQHVEGR